MRTNSRAVASATRGNGASGSRISTWHCACEGCRNGYTYSSGACSGRWAVVAAVRARRHVGNWSGRKMCEQPGAAPLRTTDLIRRENRPLLATQHLNVKVFIRVVMGVGRRPSLCAKRKGGGKTARETEVWERSRGKATGLRKGAQPACPTGSRGYLAHPKVDVERRRLRVEFNHREGKHVPHQRRHIVDMVCKIVILVCHSHKRGGEKGGK